MRKRISILTILVVSFIAVFPVESFAGSLEDYYNKPNEAVEIQFNEKKFLELDDNDYQWYKFTPKKTGIYEFEITNPTFNDYGNSEATVLIYSSVSDAQDRHELNPDFKNIMLLGHFALKLKEGHTYYIEVGCSDYEHYLDGADTSHSFVIKSHKHDYVLDYRDGEVEFMGCAAGDRAYYARLKLNKPSITRLSTGKKSFTVRYKKRGFDHDYYQIQYSTYSSFKKAKTVTAKGSSTSKTIKKLKSKKRYYVRVRAIGKVSGNKYYSSWSVVKRIKTK